MTNFDGVRALIVDDDEVSVVVLRTLLENLRVATTVIMGDNRLADRLALAEAADIVFMDLEMPTMNGYLALSALRGNPAFVGVPVVAYTTHTSHLNQARNAGFHSFLGKPLDGRRFGEQLGRILANEPVWEVS
jgi:CheY-like chemotaxis protein